jgi:hypothetical protein
VSVGPRFEIAEPGGSRDDIGLELVNEGGFHADFVLGAQLERRAHGREVLGSAVGVSHVIFLVGPVEYCLSIDAISNAAGHRQ